MTAAFFYTFSFPSFNFSVIAPQLSMEGRKNSWIPAFARGMTEN
jgi:hypothetical protein